MWAETCASDTGLGGLLGEGVKVTICWVQVGFQKVVERAWVFWFLRDDLLEKGRERGWGSNFVSLCCLDTILHPKVAYGEEWLCLFLQGVVCHWVK